MLSNSGLRRLSAGVMMFHRHFRHKESLILATLSLSSNQAPAMGLRARDCLDHLIDRCQNAYQLVGITRQSYRIMQSTPRRFIRQRCACLQTTVYDFVACYGLTVSVTSHVSGNERHELSSILEFQRPDGPDKFSLRIVSHVTTVP
jgi:hypothetical protein